MGGNNLSKYCMPMLCCRSKAAVGKFVFKKANKPNARPCSLALDRSRPLGLF